MEQKGAKTFQRYFSSPNDMRTNAYLYAKKRKEKEI